MHGRVEGDPLGVAARVGVLLVDRVGEHADRAHEQLLVRLRRLADLLDGLLDLAAHLVEGVGQEAHLVLALDGDARRVVASREPPRPFGELLDGPADLAREEHAQHRGEHGDEGDEGERLPAHVVGGEVGLLLLDLHDDAPARLVGDPRVRPEHLDRLALGGDGEGHRRPHALRVQEEPDDLDRSRRRSPGPAWGRSARSGGPGSPPRTRRRAAPRSAASSARWGGGSPPRARRPPPWSPAFTGSPKTRTGSSREREIMGWLIMGVPWRPAENALLQGLLDLRPPGAAPRTAPRCPRRPPRSRR